MQDLQRLHPDCNKIQVLAILSLVETLEEVAQQMLRSTIGSPSRLTSEPGSA
jgi:hypothetical protein